ncbi:MAG: DNA repair protein RecO [Chitinivibrionales bacterium]|nr:DNA repair protein RecO [Chitinivibrionales bacterium]MBD3394389.1 DNA repair protein RecO [Chitinivibrionales bacterium]
MELDADIPPRQGQRCAGGPAGLNPSERPPPMAPTKTRAVVLKVLPYRESSYILHLFTESHGMVHGVARGMRTARGQRFLERGFLTELLLYVKAHRDLHTLGSIQVLQFWPATRAALVRSAVRDVAFELVLASIRVTDPHPELFAFFEDLLGDIETRPERAVYPFVLWRFYLQYAAMMGFGLDLERCVQCGTDTAGRVAYVNTTRGGVECDRCARTRAPSNRIEPDTGRLLAGKTGMEGARGRLSGEDAQRITGLLAGHCRYHFDIRAESKALEFLAGVVGE